MKRIKIFLTGVVMIGLSFTLSAQMPNIKVNGKNDASVSLKAVEINVDIFGNVATTTMKMVFHNNTSRILEGELTFPMPEGVTVSRYAIDINGKMRDAVPVPKAKATEVFESIEHRQVDPGILEKVEGNNFRTRIYPLPANGDRTVLIAYEETLVFRNGDMMQYHLPLSYKESIKDFSLTTKVYKASQKPQLVEQPDGSFNFSGDNSIYEASIHKSDYNPQKSLTIGLPKNTNIPEVSLQENRDGSYYFLINAYKKGESVKKTWSDRVGIIWDNSLSGLQRDKEKELALLDLIIRQKQNLTIELGLLNITFKKAKSFTIKNGDWSELKAYLQNITYDGGTDFSKLNERALPADEYILFTEGLSTFGKSNVSINKPVYCVSSSAKADYSVMKAISAKTGGRFVNLLSMDVNNAFQSLSHNNLQFMGIQDDASISEVYPSIPTDVNGYISVAGITQRGSGEVTLLFGRNGKVESSQKIRLNNNSNDLKIHRLWAQKKIADLDIMYEQNKDDIELLGKQFGIVTRNTSLIVLEDITDYVRYEITPPVELLATYNELVKNQRVAKENRVNNLLSRAAAMTNDLKLWWETDFKVEKKYPVPVIGSIASAASRVVDVVQNSILEEIVKYEAAPEMMIVVEDEIEIMDDKRVIISSEDNAVMAQAQQYEPEAPSELLKRPAVVANKNITVNKRIAKINLPKIRSDKEYMKQISSASDAYSTYLTLRESYMGTPGFYFDVSDYFYDNNQKEKGLLILSNLADLDIENAELFKTLAYRLKEKREYKYELYITKKILDWRPMDPQSHRDYALALQDNGRYQEALDCLYSILNASYSPEAATRDYGIEEILICEINNLISLKNRKVNASAIDKGIIANLPVDIRVVINWNKNDTDIDMWVTDPNGEKCLYSNNRTAIGGRLSNDFTQGYGPEQFLLKKAINGKYKIETNFFGERQLTLSGPTTIMGEIYMYYSDGREERQVITFSNGENGRSSNGVLIGEFVFSDKKQVKEEVVDNYVLQGDEEDEIYGDEENDLAASASGSGEKSNIAGSTGIFSEMKKSEYMWIFGMCLGGMIVAYIKRKR